MLLFLVTFSTAFFTLIAAEPAVPEIILATQPCPSGWTHVSQIDQCYIIPKIFLPWSEAQSYCQNVTGGDLVSIYSQFEYDTLLRQIRTNEYSLLYPFWIGLKGEKYYPYWKWMDNHSPNFTKWINNTRPDSSTNNCIEWKTINNDGWQGINCKYSQPFICKQHAQNCPTLILNGTSGSLTSPNYPFAYDLNANCIYHINVPAGNVVEIKFSDLDVDYLADLFIYDGPSTNADTLADLAYDLFFFSTYTSTETAMTLQFVTASWMYHDATGWAATFKAIPTPSPTFFNGTSGSLTSPNYPGNYTARDTEYYKIFAPLNHRIIITIWDFVTEAGFDWLQIFDGEYLNVGTPLLDWAGNKTSQIPKILTTTTNSASLVWHTDSIKNYRGFNMTWIAENYFG
jgi:hypothetical protein